MRARTAIALFFLVSAACGRAPAAREYEVVGQIVRIDPDRPEVTLKHRDIVGFMPGMTMPFTVRDRSLLDGKEPGDLVTATLVVEEVDAYLSALIKTGHADVEAPLPPPAITGLDLLAVGDLIPDAAFVDQDGAPSPLSALRGHRVALTFIYTRCPLPDFCPLMDRQFARIQSTIRETPSLADVRLVTVTFDPEFDTPDVLKAHAEGLDADARIWRFVTGPTDEVMGFARRFGVIAEPEVPDSPVLTHNLRTAVVDAEGRLVTIVSGNEWTAAELVADLTKTPAAAQ